MRTKNLVFLKNVAILFIWVVTDHFDMFITYVETDCVSSEFIF